MRKFLLTFVVLVAGVMSAWADVAKIGSVSYASLAEAVNAAQSGDIITMQQDVALDGKLVIAAGKTIVLDLNGMTISQEMFCSASYEMILNKGNLTITGNGKLSFKDTSAGDPSFGWGSYTLRNEGTLVVENGTIEHLGEQPFATHMICAIFQYSGSTTINGGVISTPYYRSVRLWKGDMTINGGTFEGQVWVQSVDDSSVLTVNGGTFAPCGRDGSSVFVGNVTNSGVHHTAGLSVTGGTFTTKIGCNDADMLTGDLITGGSFSEAAKNNTSSSLFAADIVFDDPVDGYYNAWSPTKVLYINDLAEFLAFRAAVNGGNSFAGMTVRLTADIDLSDSDWSESIGKDYEHPFEGVFDGQGRTISNLWTYLFPKAARNNTGLFGVVGGDAEIKNLVLENVSITLAGKGQYVGAVVAYANTENGSIENVKVVVAGEEPFLDVLAANIAGVGAIVGYDDNSPSLEIKNCVVSGTSGSSIVSGAANVGGLIGYASNNVVITGNVVENLTVQGTSSVGAIAGKILTGAEVVDNTIINVLVSASAVASTAAVVAGTFEDGVIISGTDIQDVKVNGTSVDSNVLGTAVKVGDVYYTTLEAAYNDENEEETEIVLLGEHELSEAVSYTQNKGVVVNGKLTYTRGLIENWNPLYLPFEAEVNANEYKVAGFYSADGDGITLQLIAPEDGKITLTANTPYVIRYTNEEYKDLTINLNGKVLEVAEEKEATWMDETTYDNGFVIKGNYKKVTGAELTANDWVVSTAGKWGRLKSTSTLKPYRLILTTPEGFNASANAKSFSMRVLDGTTVVEEIELDLQHEECIFDLSGRRVETMTEGGIYIVNGKKVIF